MKFTLIALILTSSLSAFAQDAIDCENAMDTYSMKICASQRLDKEDKRLNDLYGKLMKKNDKVGQAKLKKAQRAWIGYRDGECSYAADSMRGGTGEGLVEVDCLAEKTKARADELKDYVDFQ